MELMNTNETFCGLIVDSRREPPWCQSTFRHPSGVEARHIARRESRHTRRHSCLSESPTVTRGLLMTTTDLGAVGEPGSAAETSSLVIERRSIDYVPLAERHGKPWDNVPIWFLC